MAASGALLFAVGVLTESIAIGIAGFLWVAVTALEYYLTESRTVTPLPEPHRSAVLALSGGWILLLAGIIGSDPIIIAVAAGTTMPLTFMAATYNARRRH